MAFVNISRQGDTQVSYRFPLDLMSETQGHYMTITAFPSQSKMSNYTDKSPISIALFIPGGNNNGALSWQMEHQYDEVKLTRLGTSFIGALPGGAALSGAAAGIGRVTGQGIINPKVDVLYANSNLRRFVFQFFMSPQSLEEQREMQGIFKVLRKFSSPEVTGTLSQADQQTATELFGNAIGDQLKTGFWFVPPAEFEIKFRYITGQGQQSENPNIPKIARSVLQRVDIDYVPPGGEFSAFRDGAPTSALLTLYFQEMRVISQQDVDNGY